MTDSPSDAAASSPGARFAAAVGSERWSDDHGTVKVFVDRDDWVAAHEALKAELPQFSWLAGVHWVNEVAVGEAPEESVEERFEVLSRLADVTDGHAVVLSTDVPLDDAVIDTVSTVFGGAEWHEREAHEMFGIDFTGHPNLTHLYLPDGFEGNPLRKDFALLSREVKPWPGTVDVEDMPSTENAEADAAAADGEGSGE